MAVKDRRILATGYNGRSGGCPALSGGRLPAFNRWVYRSGQRHEICRALHAEQNVIIQAAIHGVSLSGAELYCTTQPCLICTKMLINCGITTVWHSESYPDSLAEAMAAEAGMHMELLPLDSEPPFGVTL